MEKIVFTDERGRLSGGLEGFGSWDRPNRTCDRADHMSSIRMAKVSALPFSASASSALRLEFDCQERLRIPTHPIRCSDDI